MRKRDKHPQYSPRTPYRGRLCAARIPLFHTELSRRIRYVWGGSKAAECDGANAETQPEQQFAEEDRSFSWAGVTREPQEQTTHIRTNPLTAVDAERPSLSQRQVPVHQHRPPREGSSVLNVGDGVHLHSGSVLRHDPAARPRRRQSRQAKSCAFPRRKRCCSPTVIPFFRAKPVA